MSPVVSLLVPVFNRAELLTECLDSALAQTMRDFEVVVVDGGSTDGTWDVCQRYAAADHRIRVFRDAINTGPVRGWWRCVEEARGELATFLWSDDIIAPTFLARTVPVLTDSDVAFVFSAAEIGAKPGAGEVHYAQAWRMTSSREFIRRSLAGGASYPVSPACALFRLADIRHSFLMELPTAPTVDLTSTGAGVDVLLFLFTALRYPQVASLPEPLAFFRAHPASITVDGRGGQVAFGYAMAKGWFAATNGYRNSARSILASQWIHEMRNQERFFGPAAAAKRYRHIVSAGELLRALPILLGTQALRVSAKRIRRVRRSAS